MMRLAWCLVALFVAGCAESSAPALEPVDDGLVATPTTGIIRGVVVDPAVVPVQGATVDLIGTGLATTTDADGAFGFDGLEPGSYFLQASKAGFNGTQASAQVVAGDDRPPVVRLLMVADPTALPFIEELQFNGRLACGAAVFYTSVGCTTNGFLSDNTQSTSIWSLDFEALPRWSQGELIWESNQPLAGNFIWQIVLSEDPNTPQPHIGFMETTGSPALTYINTSVIDDNAEWILDKGVDYRFFGGPHEACPQHVGDPSLNRFGCGLTVDQGSQVIIHHFYNFAPQPGWRFTADGAHPLP